MNERPIKKIQLINNIKKISILIMLLTNIGCMCNQESNSEISIWALVDNANKFEKFNISNFANSFNQLTETEKNKVVSEYTDIYSNLCEKNILLVSPFCYTYDNEIECNVSLQDYILINGEDVYSEILDKPDSFSNYFDFRTNLNETIGIYQVLKKHIKKNQKKIIASCKNMDNKDLKNLMNKNFPTFLSKYDEFNYDRLYDCGEFTPVNTIIFGNAIK